MNVKIKKTILLSVITLLLFGCSSDDEGNNTSPTILGIWAIDTVDPDISINGIDITNIPPELLGLNESESLFLNLLLEPHTNSFYNEFQIQFNEDNSVILLTENGIVENSNYSFINNKQLIIYQEDSTEEIILNVSNITVNTVELSLDHTFAIDLNEDEIDENLRVKLLIDLIK